MKDFCHWIKCILMYQLSEEDTSGLISQGRSAAVGIHCGGLMGEGPSSVERKMRSRTLQEVSGARNGEGEFAESHPLILTEPVRKKLRRIALKNRKYSLRELARILQTETGVLLTAKSIRSCLLSMGLRRRVAVRKPVLSRAQRLARKKWAKAMRGLPLEYWQGILFSDEKIFLSDNNRRTVFVTRAASEKFLPACIQHTRKHGPQVHVWGAVSFHGVGPIKRIEGALNAARYQQEIIHDLDEVLLEFGEIMGP